MVIDNTGAGVGSASKVDEYAKHYRTTIPDAIPFLWSHRTKKRFIDQLCLVIEQHRISVPASLDGLHHQLGIYEYQDKGEWVSFSAPPEEHDDYVSALAMAYNAALLGWAGRPNMAGLAKAFA